MEIDIVVRSYTDVLCCREYGQGRVDVLHGLRVYEIVDTLVGRYRFGRLGRVFCPALVVVRSTGGVYRAFSRTIQSFCRIGPSFVFSSHFWG